MEDEVDWLCDSVTDSDSVTIWVVGLIVGHIIGAPGCIPPPDPAPTESI